MHDFILRVTPTRFEAEVGAVCGFLGALYEAICGYNDAIPLLLFAMCIDYITGITAAYVYKRRHPKSKKGLDSRVGMVGIAKKILILTLVVFSHIIDQAVSFDGIEAVVSWFFIGNEGLSIVENAAKAGVPIPRRLLDALEQLTDKKNKEAE
jgi:toxin secretion/phage lysis holin